MVPFLASVADGSGARDAGDGHDHNDTVGDGRVIQQDGQHMYTEESTTGCCTARWDSMQKNVRTFPKKHQNDLLQLPWSVCLHATQQKLAQSQVG